MNDLSGETTMLHTRFLFRVAAFCAVFVCLIGSGPAHAFFNSITGTAANPNVALGGTPTTVTIVWRVRTVVGAPSGPTVRSTPGTFLIPGARGAPPTVLGTVSTVLSHPISAGQTVFITESLLVPIDVIFRAHKFGATSFLFFRDFDDGTGLSGQPQVPTLFITSSTATGFGITREALSFDNGAPVRILERKQPLRANAEINFSGSGLMQAVWEIADPASTAGVPAFRVLSTVRQYLVGSDTQTLQSPALPTDNAGLYLLRLRITDPAPGFDTPVIRYFVTDPQTAGQLPAVPLGLVTPPNQILLAPDTTFAWEAIPGARAYQLEIYAKPILPGDTLPDLGSAIDTTPPALPLTPPVTGMMVPGAKTRTVLSDTARAHLVSGQRYLWRVLAIGAEGNIIGESAVREFRIP